MCNIVNMTTRVPFIGRIFTSISNHHHLFANIGFQYNFRWTIICLLTIVSLPSSFNYFAVAAIERHHHQQQNQEPLVSFSSSEAAAFSNSNSNSNNMNNYDWQQHTLFSKPYFDMSTRRDVFSIVGQTTLLQCKVRNLGDRAVSWIRQRDLHILTVGILTYTNEERFRTQHSDGSDQWTLRIASTRLDDGGTYECQVSTEPKISLSFKLTVLVSKAVIAGNSEIYVKNGTDIQLVCGITAVSADDANNHHDNNGNGDNVDAPTYIYWYRNDHLINYQQQQQQQQQRVPAGFSGGIIDVFTDKQTKTSRLHLKQVQPSDSANYTCAPANSFPASVIVHVLNNGEHRAAMQHINSDSNVNNSACKGRSSQIIDVIILISAFLMLLNT